MAAGSPENRSEVDMFHRGRATQFPLDHVSIAVPDFGAAVERLERLGLEVKASPEAPDRHGRVHLDRAYLEVAARSESPMWEVGPFFLRYSDLDALRSHLDRVGFGYRHQVYEGVDGRWDDVELNLAEVPMPILVRRTEPAEVARDWPPSLDCPHRCGALTLAAVHIPVTSVTQGVDAYARLLAVEPSEALTGPGPARQRAMFRLKSGVIVLVEGDDARALVLGVSSLEASRAVLGSALLPTDEGGVAWLEPSATSNLAIGFAERERYQ